MIGGGACVVLVPTTKGIVCPIIDRSSPQHSLDVSSFHLYNTRKLTRTIYQLSLHSLPRIGLQEANGSRTHRTTTRQLPAGQPVGTGWLCRGLPRSTPATLSANGHQGAA